MAVRNLLQYIFISCRVAAPEWEGVAPWRNDSLWNIAAGTMDQFSSENSYDSRKFWRCKAGTDVQETKNNVFIPHYSNFSYVIDVILICKGSIESNFRTHLMYNNWYKKALSFKNIFKYRNIKYPLFLQ